MEYAREYAAVFRALPDNEWVLRLSLMTPLSINKS